MPSGVVDLCLEPLFPQRSPGTLAIEKMFNERGLTLRDVTKTNSKGQTVMHLAASIGAVDGKTEYLETIKQIADVTGVFETLLESRTNSGLTPLLSAMRVRNGDGNFRVATWLLEHNADPSAVDTYGQTALMFACNRHHLDLVELVYKLCDAEDITKETDYGHTPMVSALIGGGFRTVQWLVLMGVPLPTQMPKVHVDLMPMMCDLQNWLESDNPTFVDDDFQSFVDEDCQNLRGQWVDAAKKAVCGLLCDSSQDKSKSHTSTTTPPPCKRKRGGAWLLPPAEKKAK